LRAAALCAADRIPLELLRSGAALSSAEFFPAVRELEWSGVLRRPPEEDAVSIHRMTQVHALTDLAETARAETARHLIEYMVPRYHEALSTQKWAHAKPVAPHGEALLSLFEAGSPDV